MRLSDYRNMRDEVEMDADADPEVLAWPERRFWLKRHHLREARLQEMREAMALTRNPNDPAPLSSWGFETFMEWVYRQRPKDGEDAAQEP